MNGFLVRADGAMISLDHIILINREVADPRTIPATYNINIYLIEGHRIQWNTEPRQEKEIAVLLKDLRTNIQKAIEL